MDHMRTVPVPGEFYRHFKNRLYQIISIAYHSETNEAMVVYQALYGEYKMWVRPLSMFMEEVDRVKYPDVEQTYRFERVDLGNGLISGQCYAEQANTELAHTEKIHTENSSASASQKTAPSGYGEIRPMSPYLLEFFDAMDEKKYDYMLEAVAKLAGQATQKEIDDICLVLDMQTIGQSVEEQIAEIRRHIRMLKKFDGERLR